MPTLSDLQSVVDSGVRVGVTDLAPFPQERERIVRSVANGLSGGLGFTYASPEIASRPLSSFPWAASIVVIAVPYLIDGDARLEYGHRSVARFADGDRYAGVRAALSAIGEVLQGEGFRADIVVDDDRLIDRAVAVRAGVAWNGKSTMVLTPGQGPWILIGSVVTDVTLDPTPVMVRGCGTCTACIPACPTGAIVEPGVLDASLCLAAVLQRPGPIPVTLREAVGSRLYGCDECLTACPPGDQALLRVEQGRRPITAREILGMSDGEIDAMFLHWYVPKRNMRFVRRNALVALGNCGTDADLGIIAGYLGHPDALLRQHAAWAAGSIGGGSAVQILRFARRHESDPHVAAEISEALALTSSGEVYAEPESGQRRGRSEAE